MRHLLCLLLIFCALHLQVLHAQQPFSRQLQLVDTLRNYIDHDLHLLIPNEFYRSWDNRTDSMYLFLYASRADKITPADTAHRHFWYFNNEDSAQAKSKQLMKAGFETLVYKTAGTSGAALTSKLLSYPDEAIAFIVCHEAVHNDLKFREEGIPYRYEEALCDVIANQACLQFARHSGLVDTAAVLKQQRIFENVYYYMNQQRSGVEKATPKQKKKLQRSCNKRLKQLTLGANAFQIDRLLYPVNNAYFLRLDAYAVHYFEVKQLYAGTQDMESLIQQINEAAQPNFIKLTAPSPFFK